MTPTLVSSTELELHTYTRSSTSSKEMKKEPQTTTRVQLVKMLRNMTDYSNMYNTIPNCLKAKMRRIVDFTNNRCHYCMDAIT